MRGSFESIVHAGWRACAHCRVGGAHTHTQEMGLTADQYLVRLRDPKEWGGGLEIVALANALQRPIFLYELKPVGILFWSKCVAWREGASCSCFFVVWGLIDWLKAQGYPSSGCLIP